MSGEAGRKRPENMVDLLIETAKAFANGCMPHKEFQRCRQQVIDSMATPPGYELVPEGTEAKNPNLLFYEYETDLILAARALESSMPNAAGRVRWLASLLAKTKPPKETPNAQG